MPNQPPIIEYCSPPMTTRRSKSGVISLRLGLVAPLVLALFLSGVFDGAGVAELALVALFVLMILSALGCGIVGIIDKSALAIPATILAAAELVGFISLVAFWLSHMPVC